MGQLQDTNSCCLVNAKQSILEVDFLEEPLRKSFCIEPDYESPIPNEIFEDDQRISNLTFYFSDDSSNELRKPIPVTPGNSRPKSISIYMSRRLTNT